MAETFISNIFSPLSERLRSPLLSAIIIAWFAWNWEIIYITLFLSFPEGAVSKLEMVKPLISWQKSLLWPFCSGIVYVAVVPFLEDIAFRVIEWHKAIRKDRKVKMLGMRKNISSSELLQKYKELKEANEQIASVIEERSQLNLKISEFEKELNSTKKSLFDAEIDKKSKAEFFERELNFTKSDAEKLKAELKNFRPTSIFTPGRWKCEWRLDKVSGGDGSEYFTVMVNDENFEYQVEGGSKHLIIGFKSSLVADGGKVKFYKLMSESKRDIFGIELNMKVVEINLDIKENGVLEGYEIYNAGDKVPVKFTRVRVDAH